MQVTLGCEAAAKCVPIPRRKASPGREKQDLPTTLGGPSAQLRGSQDRLWPEERLVLRARKPGKLCQEASLNLDPEGWGGLASQAELGDPGQ